jgi:hypothetical protein
MNKSGKIILALNLVVLLVIGYLLYITLNDLALIAQQVQVQGEYQRQSIEIIKEDLVKVIKVQIGIDIADVNIHKEFLEKIQEQNINLERMKKDLLPIDLPNVNNIRASNLVLFNRTVGALGSGTHIKIKNQDYILTAGHLVENDDDIMEAMGTTGQKYPIKLIKVNHAVDLAIFKIDGACPQLGTLELSTEAPLLGSEVVAIGNPGGDCNVITQGTVCKIETEYYKVTNLCFFGNSGGALLYRGKVVGVCSQVDIKTKPPVTVVYTEFVKLDLINAFLKEYTESN